MARFKSAADIKVAVIGYGGAFNMGKHHLNEMKKAGMTPVAVCELDAKRLETAQADFPGIKTYTTVKALLAATDANIVTLITPHNTHAPLALQCLAAGKGVVSEKPFAITTAECDAMIAAAKKKNLLLSTYHNRHWDGCILNTLKVVKSGAIGEVVRIEAHMGGWGQPRDWWRTSKSISGGILYDWGVHLLEYSLQVLQSEIVEVNGFAHSGFWAPKTAWKKDTNEDEAFAVVRFKSGAWLTLMISQLDSRSKWGQLEITGTKGTHAFDYSTYETITHDGDQTVVTKGKNPDSEGWKFYQNIANHLTKAEKLIITGEWARRPIHILDLANTSAKKGRAVSAKYK
ncbi:MAG TPA: Gfo/Idh/MocA family oxidoreductase [Planctomycetota bacterium]|nr:Gfo/Idh/MocA family oxidoreductase [Planctomycetota bacterium]